MPIHYLNNKSWLEITREERLFCAYLYFDIIKNGIQYFISQLNKVRPETESFDRKIELESNKEWDIGFEVCFYRDLLFSFENAEPIRIINKRREEKGLQQFPEKRTFDLCLFSEDEVVIVEAKSQQGLKSEQCNAISSDLDKMKQLFSEIGIPNQPKIKLLIVASSKYLQSSSFTLENGIGKKFIEDNKEFVSGLVSWEAISQFSQYSENKEIYKRADKSYGH